jgi:dolichol kinase
MVIILIIANLIILTLDINRHSVKKIQYLADKFFISIMRPHEYSNTRQLSGMSYMFLGFLITAIIFNKNKVIISWLILIIGDSVAALYGKMYGTPNQEGKSLEGSLAFVLSSLVIYLIGNIFFDLHVGFIRACFAILVAAIAEFYSKRLKVDDNLLIPIAFCCFA